MSEEKLNFIKDSRLQFCYYYFIQNPILVDHRINKKQLILFLNAVHSLSLLYWQFTEITVIQNHLSIPFIDSFRCHTTKK